MGQEHKKSKKIILIAIVFLFVILVATYVVYSYYVKNIAKEALKKEVLESVKKNDLSFFLNHELYESIFKRLEKNNFELASDITLSTTMKNNMFSELDLSKFQFHYDFLKNDKKAYHKLQTGYAGNDFIIFDFVTTPKQFAMKSDEIVNKYVGINHANVQNTVNQFYDTEVDLSDFKKAKNFILDRENIHFSDFQNVNSLKNYVALMEKEILAENISKKENVVITINSEQIATTEYTISLDSNQVNHLLEGITEIIENDQEVIPNLVASKVEEIEKEENNFLEYTDNDNAISIPGEENNFHASIQIWDANTTNLNTIPSNTVLEQEDSNSQNAILNQVSSENSPITAEEENSINEETPYQEIPEESIEETPERTTQTEESERNLEVLNEEDNFRLQGYIEVNENTIDYSDDDTFIIGENYEDTLKNIIDWTNNINWTSYLMTGAKVNCTENELKEKIQNILTKRIKQNNSLIIKLYVSQNKTVKIHFEIPQTLESFDIAIFSKNDNEKYLTITNLIGEENNASGHITSFYVKKSDAVTGIKVNLQKISKNKISQKTNLNLETKGTLNAKKYTMNLEVSYSDSEGEFKIVLNNSLNFDVTPEIEDLNEENCLFLDQLSKEELQMTMDAIKQKTLEVLREKNRNLNIVDLNNSNLIVQQTEQNNMTEEDLMAKEQAKQALIKNIADKMRDYQNEGKELKIEDLQGLEIPDYQVEISISSNLAIITVNGYKFNLDSDFNLSD